MKSFNEFENIYVNKIWGDGSSKPLSGTGSNSQNAKKFVEYVKNVLTNFELKSVVDVGHGDLEVWGNWGFDNINYTGIEVAETPHLIAKVKRPKMKFILLNDFAELSNLPRADIVICKDVLQHLPNNEILYALNVFKNFKYILLCNDIFVKLPGLTANLRHYIRFRSRFRQMALGKNPFFSVSRKNNQEILVGQCRGLDFQDAPFSDFITSHEILEILDYDGPTRLGIKKRIYLLRRLQ